MMHKAPEYAEVIKVPPLTKTIHTPRQDCHDETVTHQGPVKDQHQVFGTVAGAGIGGVIGHQAGGAISPPLRVRRVAAMPAIASRRICRTRTRTTLPSRSAPQCTTPPSTV